MIKKEEIDVLRESGKNARMAINAIDTVLSKVYDDEFSYELNHQAGKFREMERKIDRAMIKEGIAPGEGSTMEKAMLWSSIQANTLLNTNTSHLAGMMIQGNTRGITDLMKVTRNNKVKNSYANELAKELMDFEEKNIEKLKTYL